MASILLEKKFLNDLNSVSKQPLIIIEEANRYDLVSSITKNTIQIYPNTVQYHANIPINIPPVNLGIYTIGKPSDIMKLLIDTSRFFLKNVHNTSDIL